MVEEFGEITPKPDDLRRRDGVPVVGVVEQEPAAGRPGQHDRELAVAQERLEPHLVPRREGGVATHRAVAELR